MFGRIVRTIALGFLAGCCTLFVAHGAVVFLSVRYRPGANVTFALDWLPAVAAWAAAGAAAVITWRFLRPPHAHACPGCGYDLRSASTNACPECGRDRGAVQIVAYRRRSGWVIVALATGALCAIAASLMRSGGVPDGVAIAASMAIVALSLGWMMVFRCPRCRSWLRTDDTVDPEPDDTGRVKVLYLCRRCNIAWWTGSCHPE